MYQVADEETDTTLEEFNIYEARRWPELLRWGLYVHTVINSTVKRTTTKEGPGAPSIPRERGPPECFSGTYGTPVVARDIKDSKEASKGGEYNNICPDGGVREKWTKRT